MPSWTAAVSSPPVSPLQNLLVFLSFTKKNKTKQNTLKCIFSFSINATTELHLFSYCDKSDNSCSLLSFLTPFSSSQISLFLLNPFPSLQGLDCSSSTLMFSHTNLLAFYKHPYFQAELWDWNCKWYSKHGHNALMALGQTTVLPRILLFIYLKKITSSFFIFHSFSKTSRCRFDVEEKNEMALLETSEIQNRNELGLDWKLKHCDMVRFN